MKLPGFTPGESAQNAVVGFMYVVVIIVVVGAAMAAGVPGMLSGGGDSGNSGAASNSSGQQTQAQSQSQGRSQSQGQSQGSGWVTVTSSGGSGSGESASGTSTPRISEDQVQLQLVRNAMANSSRVQLVSAEIRNNELYVQYTQDDMSRSEVLSGMGTVVGSYVGLVGTGADVQAVHGRLVDETGQPAYTYTVERDVVEQYNNGQMSDSQFRQEIVSSLNATGQASTTTA